MVNKHVAYLLSVELRRSAKEVFLLNREKIVTNAFCI